MRPRRAEAWAHGKVNIGWRVGAKREDGYHDVSGLMQTISLADHLIFESNDSDTISVDVPGHPELESPHNIVYDAASAVVGEFGGVTITIDKKIPIAAGLGGGSADAAATLVALNMLWGGELSARQLVERAAVVGSDVAAILMGGLVHASGRGERVKRIGASSGYSLILGISDTAIATADAYRAFDSIPPTTSDRIEHNDLEAAACALDDRLPGRIEVMRDACGVAFVSGSGPTVVGVTMQPEDAVARVRDSFERVEVAEPSESGVVLRLK